MMTFQFTLNDTQVLLENDTSISDNKIRRFISEYALLYLEGFLPENKPKCLNFLVEEEDIYYKIYQEGTLIIEMNRKGNHNIAYTSYPANDFQMSFIRRRQSKGYNHYTALELLSI